MLLLLCAAAILLSSLLLAILIRFMLRVTDRLSTQLSSLNAADLSRRIHLPDAPREFQPVIDTVNALLARLADAFDRERSFSADVAHELRTPLASLQTTLDVALRRQPNDPANRTALERCHPVVRHMGAIVENLLTISRADAGQLSFIPEPVDLPALLHECWQPFADRAAAHNLHLTWNLTPSHSLPTDPHHLRFILRNLLDNAVTYTPPAGSIAISTASTDSHVELSIQNTGCTLTPQQLDQIFQRFWRADSSRSPTDAHAGLGLSLCRRLATTLHGTLTAHLTDTTFTISLLLPAPVPAPIRTS
jgi:two-component system sensor histidine kinase QseC